MKHHLLRFWPFARVTALVGVPCMLLGCFIMSPLWGARFHPVDDHEYAAMLSLTNNSAFDRIYTRVFEMSPAANYPDSLHWRPAVWLARAVEAELFEKDVSSYFYWRTFLLAGLGFLAAAYCKALQSVCSPANAVSLGGILSGPLLSLLVISNPTLFDVFGRLLPGEMYTAIGLVCLVFAWTQLIANRTAFEIPGRMTVVLTWLGLCLIATGKEDAAVLWPIAIALGFPELRYLASRNRIGFLVAITTSGALWAAGAFQTYRMILFKGASLPYQDQSTSGLQQILKGLIDVDFSSLLFSLASLLLALILGRRLCPDFSRLLLFFPVVMFFELLYVSSVPQQAPRYSAVFLLMASLFFWSAITIMRNVISSVCPGKYYRILIALIAVLLIGVGAIYQRGRNEVYRDISVEWDEAIGRVIHEINDSHFDQILLVVDPPDENSIGRWEKSISLAKQVRWRSAQTIKVFLETMDPEEKSFSVEVKSSLDQAAVMGMQDAAGYVFNPRQDLAPRKLFCVLYSESGRNFLSSDRCDTIVRFTL